MTSVLAVAVLVLGATAYSITVRTLTAQVDSELQAEAHAYSAALRSAPETEAVSDATRAYLQGRAVTGSGRDVVLSVTFDSGHTMSNSDLRLERAPDNAAVRTPIRRQSFSTVTVAGDAYRVLSVPVYAKAGRVATFQAAIAQASFQDAAGSIALTLAAAGLIALAIALPLSYFATRGSLQPLTHMARDAAEISHAQPGRRIDYEGPDDELGSLAESLNAMLARLERSFEDQRQFVADASHELRTPVAVIRGNIELMRSTNIGDADREQALAMISDEACRMTRLLDDLLSLARFERGGARHFQPLSAQTLLEEARARARAAGSVNVDLTAGCDAWIDGDPDLLDQAIANLVRNASEHAGDSGHIRLACNLDGTSVVMSVTDDGPGIAEEDLDRIFDRFYRPPGQPRAGESAGGAGLGLAITRRIIEAHGGTVRAENAQPTGARFVVTLPASSEQMSGGNL